MAPHSSTLAWKISWMEEPGTLQSMGLLGVGHDWVTSLSLFTFMYWRRKWQPTPVFLPGESQGRGALWAAVYGSHRVQHDWSDLAAAAAERLQQSAFGFLGMCVSEEGSGANINKMIKQKCRATAFPSPGFHSLVTSSTVILFSGQSDQPTRKDWKALVSSEK